MGLLINELKRHNPFLVPVVLLGFDAGTFSPLLFYDSI